MSTKRQRKKRNRVSVDTLKIKTALLRRGLSIAGLGESISRPRSTVSQAINQGFFPKVIKQIEEELCL